MQSRSLCFLEQLEDFSRACITLLAILYFSTGSAAEETQTDHAVAPEMALIPGASVEIGSLIDYRAQPIHRVNIAPFYISKYEITFDQFDRFTDATGKARRNDLGWGRGNRPVVDVSWTDIHEYIDWLNDVTGESYRLPTEAEWEYAAKGNSGINQFGWGNQFEHNRANCRNCGSPGDGSGTVPVGSFAANPLGLYDMHGNVWEITASCYSLTYRENSASHAQDEQQECKSIIVRGGSWDTEFEEIKTWYRASYNKDSVSNDVGFRLVKELR